MVQLAVWFRSQTAVLKISSDGVFAHQSSKGVIGIVARDADGKFVAARDVSLSNISAVMVQSRWA